MPLRMETMFSSSAVEQTLEPRGSDARARGLILEPVTDIEIEPSAFKVVQERSSQPFTEPGRRFPSGIVMQKIILREAFKLRPENSQAMGSGIQSYRAVSRHREAMPKG